MTIPTALSVERRPFGSTGLLVSPLGFGGAPIGVLASEVDAVKCILSDLLDAGMNLIDTAACYHGSEDLIGQSVSARRHEFILVTKCGHNVAKDGRPDFSAEVISESIDRSLKRLRTDHLDVILLHSCDLATLKSGEAIAAVVEARDKGKVRFIGYSGDNDAAAWAVQQPEISVLQTSVSVCDQRNIEAVLPLAFEHEVAVMAKRPVANGAWRPLTEQYEKYQNYTRPYRERFEQMGLSALDITDTGIDFTNDSNAAWCELFLRFTLSQSSVGTAIVGTTKRRHVQENITAVNRGPLSQAVVERLRHAFREAENSDTWEGLT